jgi:GxxExxY protein
MDVNLHGHDPLTEQVIGAAIEVHKALGPGLLESAYEQCLGIVLEEVGLKVARQVDVPLEFRGRRITPAYRLDILVNDVLIVEVKAVEKLMPVHDAQLLTYLRLTGKRVGLLLNFNSPRIKDGLRRMVL